MRDLRERYVPSAAKDATCNWGLDLSHTIHDAGNIGGLLACEETEGTQHEGKYWFFHDVNGNLGQAFKVSTGAVAAHYEYDPYGNQLVPPPSLPNANPYRLRTKWLDDELAAGGQAGTGA